LRKLPVCVGEVPLKQWLQLICNNQLEEIEYFGSLNPLKKATLQQALDTMVLYDWKRDYKGVSIVMHSGPKII
jgi:hypothetical protein